MARLEVGVVASIVDRGPDVVALCRAVESAGLDPLLFTEHTHLPLSRRDLIEDPLQREGPHLLDPFVLLGAAAVVTSTLRIGTGVCVVPQHDPISLAKRILTVDHLSGGRFVFGAGAGWLIEELRNHGVPPECRLDVMRDKILAMKEIWTRDQAEYHGTFADFDPIWMWPKPVHKPHPPVLIGGDAPGTLRVAAECGDGWFPIVTDPAIFGVRLATLRDLCDRRERPMLDVTAMLWEPDAELVSRCVELGVTRYVVFWLPPNDPDAFHPFFDSCLQLTHCH